MGLHCSRAYLKGRKKPESLEDLASHSIIGFDLLAERASRVMNLPDLFAKSSLNYSTDSSALHLRLLDSGCGMGLSLVNVNQLNRIRVLPTLVNFHSDVWIAMHEELKKSKKFRSVFKELSETIKTELSYAQGKS